MKTRRCSLLAGLIAGGFFLTASANAQVEERGADWARLRNAARSILGWRVGVSAASFRQSTFFDAIDQAASPLFLRVIEGSSAQRVSADIPKPLDLNLTAAEVKAVTGKLAAAGVRMTAYDAGAIGPDENAARKLFQFAKSLNVETVVSAPAPEVLPLLDKLGSEFGINVALRNGGPKDLLQATEGRSQRIGASADLNAWTQQGVKPLEGLAQLKDRLLTVNLRDNAALPAILEGLSRMRVQPLLLIVEETRPQAFDDLEKALQPVAGDRVAELSRATPMTSPDRLAPEARAKIEAAIPLQAPAKPKKPRRLLVMDLTVAYGISDHLDGGAAANLMLALLSKKTGAFEAIFSNDMANLKYENLKQFDGLYLNNTVGMLFVDPQIRDSLLRFVREGGGLAGHHGTSHASQDWPEFYELIGGRGGTHKSLKERVTVKLDDPASPINAAFKGQEFEAVDEFYRYITGGYSRERQHILLSIDTEKTDMSQPPACPRCARPDNDYGISWIRSYGKGRVFYCSMGHMPTMFMTPPLVQHLLAGIQFALGDLDSDTTPSAKLAAARR